MNLDKVVQQFAANAEQSALASGIEGNAEQSKLLALEPVPKV